jgi:hypothetical protein
MGTERSDKVEWMLEITRRDGGDIEPGEVLDALGDPHHWRRLSKRPEVFDDGKVRAGKKQFQILPRPSGTRDRVLFAMCDAKGILSLMPLFTVLNKALHGRYGSGWAFRLSYVLRIRHLAYCGRMPREITRFTLPHLGCRLRTTTWFGFSGGSLFMALFGFGPVLIHWKLDGFDFLLNRGLFPINVILLLAVITMFGCGVFVAWSFLMTLIDRNKPVGFQGVLFNFLHRGFSENICWAAIAARVCHACGYDLRESENDRCPECAHPNLRWWCERDRLAEAATALPKAEGE